MNCSGVSGGEHDHIATEDVVSANEIFNDLPDELIYEIFKNLNTGEFTQIERVCHRFKNIAADCESRMQSQKFETFVRAIIQNFEGETLGSYHKKKCLSVLDDTRILEQASRWELKRSYEALKYQLAKKLKHISANDIVNLKLNIPNEMLPEGFSNFFDVLEGFNGFRKVLSWIRMISSVEDLESYSVKQILKGLTTHLPTAIQILLFMPKYRKPELVYLVIKLILEGKLRKAETNSPDLVEENEAGKEIELAKKLFYLTFAQKENHHSYIHCFKLSLQALFLAEEKLKGRAAESQSNESLIPRSEGTNPEARIDHEEPDTSLQQYYWEIEKNQQTLLIENLRNVLIRFLSRTNIEKKEICESLFSQFTISSDLSIPEFRKKLESFKYTLIELFIGMSKEDFSSLNRLIRNQDLPYSFENFESFYKKIVNWDNEYTSFQTQNLPRILEDWYPNHLQKYYDLTYLVKVLKSYPQLHKPSMIFYLIRALINEGRVQEANELFAIYRANQKNNTPGKANDLDEYLKDLINFCLFSAKGDVVKSLSHLTKALNALRNSNSSTVDFRAKGIYISLTPYDLTCSFAINTLLAGNHVKEAIGIGQQLTEEGSKETHVWAKLLKRVDSNDFSQVLDQLVKTDSKGSAKAANSLLKRARLNEAMQVVRSLIFNKRYAYTLLYYLKTFIDELISKNLLVEASTVFAWLISKDLKFDESRCSIWPDLLAASSEANRWDLVLRIVYWLPTKTTDDSSNEKEVRTPILLETVEKLLEKGLFSLAVSLALYVEDKEIRNNLIKNADATSPLTKNEERCLAKKNKIFKHALKHLISQEPVDISEAISFAESVLSKEIDQSLIPFVFKFLEKHASVEQIIETWKNLRCSKEMIRALLNVGLNFLLKNNIDASMKIAQALNKVYVLPDGAQALVTFLENLIATGNLDQAMGLAGMMYSNYLDDCYQENRYQHKVNEIFTPFSDLAFRFIQQDEWKKAEKVMKWMPRGDFKCSTLRQLALNLSSRLDFKNAIAVAKCIPDQKIQSLTLEEIENAHLKEKELPIIL